MFYIVYFLCKASYEVLTGFSLELKAEPYTEQLLLEQLRAGKAR
jgi:hypothetical protein